MKKALGSFFSVFIALAFVSSTAFPWGSATHAYIDDHIGKTLKWKNLNEMYGGTAPDIFNYMFGAPYQMDLRNLTHGVPGDYSFLQIWNKAKSKYQKAVGYGFVSHNDVWGADSTAHWQAQYLTLPPGYPGFLPPGYVIIKAYLLEQMLGVAWATLGIVDYNIKLNICHNLVEAAGDIFIGQVDPNLGSKLSSAALLRHPSFPSLLVRAYARDISAVCGMPFGKAVKTIMEAEREFREIVILLGQVISQDLSTAIDLTAEQLAELAVGYLASEGITLPPWVTPEMLKEFAIQGLLGSLVIISGDYMLEVQATINHVAGQMNGLDY